MNNQQIEAVTRAPERDHEFAREHLPWAAAGTLDELAQRRVQEHAALCAECRDALEQQQRLVAAMQTAPVVELAPQAGLAKLMARIDAREAQRSRIARLLRPLFGERAQRPLVFTVAIQALVIVMLTVGLVAGLLREPAPAQYRTLSNATAPAAAGDARVRAVFDGQLTLAQLRTVLAPLHMRIVDGPGEGGIVTLAVDGDPQAAVLALRAQSGVQFAELVRTR